MGSSLDAFHEFSEPLRTCTGSAYRLVSGDTAWWPEAAQNRRSFFNRPTLNQLERARQLIERFIQAVNERDTSGAQACLTPGARSVVYTQGVVCGVFADGEAFEGVRYVDRFEIVEGSIVSKKVWSDMGDRLRNWVAEGRVREIQVCLREDIAFVFSLFPALLEQNARLALQFTCRAYVLEMGEVALEGPSRELSQDPRMVNSYLGSEARHA